MTTAGGRDEPREDRRDCTQEVIALPEAPTYRELKMCTRLHEPVWAVSPLGNSGSSYRDTEVPSKETEVCAVL